jgi:hypothetical protein
VPAEQLPDDGQCVARVAQERHPVESEAPHRQVAELGKGPVRVVGGGDDYLAVERLRHLEDDAFGAAPLGQVVMDQDRFHGVVLSPAAAAVV